MRRWRRRGGFTSAHEHELAGILVKIRELRRSGGPKPVLPPAELARWEEQREHKMKVEKAWEITTGYQAPFYGDDAQNEIADGD
ncbi:hypothetical protein [Sphingomonas sp. PP-CE-3G-477]|uniref:hypothetical protein n=1 Tax=Sphingomonas sp. PP-CE-3G-477 TaxID=2135660 RepID=UPI0011B1E105|nr:hypothetical protein [Sphingomonas sp. PP-CE-3G-477]